MNTFLQNDLEKTAHCMTGSTTELSGMAGSESPYMGPSNINHSIHNKKKLLFQTENKHMYLQKKSFRFTQLTY